MIINPNILIVDDKPHNIILLSSMLKQAGYNVKSTTSGMDALQEVKNSLPDLILLDINMPEMDGYEVCRKLKSDEKSKEIPVLFLSAMTDTEAIVKAFENGGVDYITKPFQFEEVKARVKTHIIISSLKLELKKHNENLEKLVSKRTEELEKAYKRLKNIDIIKSSFLEIISDEFRAPLTGMHAAGEYLFGLNSQKENDEYLFLKKMFANSKNKMMKLLDDATMINKCETSNTNNSSGVIALNEIIESGADGFICNKRPEYKDLSVSGEPDMLKNAMKMTNELAKCFVDKTANANLEISIENDIVYLKYVLDNMNMSEIDAEKFFELSSEARCSTYSQTKDLSPTVVQKMLNIFGGELKFVKQKDNNGWLIVTLTLVKSDNQGDEIIAQFER